LPHDVGLEVGHGQTIVPCGVISWIAGIERGWGDLSWLGGSADSSAVHDDVCPVVHVFDVGTERLA